MAGVCGGAEAEDRPKRRDNARPADSYHVLFADGSEVAGKSIDRWEDHKSTSVAGRRLFDRGRPALFLQNTSRKLASPGARVILANCDIVPGRLVGIERAEDLPGRPVCLRIMPSLPVRNGRTPEAGIPVPPQYVRRVITGAKPTGRSSPGTVLLQNRSFVSCQAMKWTLDGLSVLTASGTRTHAINELADAYMPQADVIGRVLDDALAPCPQCDSLILRLTTIGGAILTFRPAMMRLQDKRWLVVQPAWSLHAIRLPVADVCALSIRRHDEVPLSLLPAETLVEKAFTGFVWKWRRDRSVRGGPLVSGSLTSDMGIGTHAYSAIAFDLPRGAASFTFHAGLDNNVGAGGCVRLKVCGDKADSKPLWTSGFLRGGDKPLSVRALNCRDAKRLVLITEFAHKGRPPGADPFDIRDEVNWLMPTVRLDSAAMARHYGGAVRHFTGLGGWSLAEPEAAKVQLSAKWDNTDGRWEPGLLVGASGLTLTRKIRVTRDTAWLWMSAVGRDGNHKISLWIGGKPVKCASGQAHLATAGEPQAARWRLQPHLGKDVTLMLKVRPGDPSRASPLTRPEIWFTREPVIIPTSRSDPHVVSRPIRNMPELGKGMVRVLGKHARISGSRNARFDSEMNALAYWWRGNTWFSWAADVPKSGKYVVQMTYGCISRAAGSTYEIAVGDRKVRGVVGTTGRWATFTTDDVGTIELDKRGPATITVGLLHTPGKGIMTLHAVTLVPAK